MLETAELIASILSLVPNFAGQAVIELNDVGLVQSFLQELPSRLNSDLYIRFPAARSMLTRPTPFALESSSFGSIGSRSRYVQVIRPGI